jgi:hypothetical protein
MKTDGQQYFQQIEATKKAWKKLFVHNQRKVKFEISCERKLYNDETTLLVYY